MTKDETEAAWKVRYIVKTALLRTVVQPYQIHKSRVPSIKLMRELMPECSLTRCRDFINALENAMEIQQDDST